MSELPKGWADSSLGEITVLRGEKLDPATLPDAPFIGLEDIEPHTSRILKTGKGSDVKSSVARFSAGNILYSRLRPYLNKVTVPDFDGIASAEILVLQPTAATEAEFVRRRIMTREFLDFAALLDKGDRPRVNFKEISEFPVALPPLPEQRRIVAKVDGLTARTARARKELDRIPTLIAHYKQRLLALAFSGDLTAGWRKENNIQTSQQTKLVGNLIADVIGGKNLRCVERPPEKSERGVVKVSAVTWGEFNPLASKTLPSNFDPPAKTKIRPGDFLISRANTLELVAAVVIVKETPDNLYLSDKILRLELPEADKPWLLWFMRSPQGRSEIEARATGNQFSMRNLSQNGLRSIEMPWPNASERAEIVRRIESAFSWLDRMAADHAAAARLLPKLDAAILAKAFRGELVPQDPNDEPASVLLARVKAEREVGGARRSLSKRFTLNLTKEAERKLKELQNAMPPTFADLVRESIVRSKTNMAKSRQDDDVKGKPYLAALLKSGRISDAQSLFRSANLPVADFYKQLAWEIDNKHIIDSADELKAA